MAHVMTTEVTTFEALQPGGLCGIEHIERMNQEKYIGSTSDVSP